MDLILEGLQEAWRLLITGDPTTLHAAGTSITCTVIAVLLASVLAIPYGAWLGFYRKRSRVRVLLLRLGMSFPTVLIGLLVFALLSRRGLFGDLDLLYTRSAIIMGEFLLAFPLLGALAQGLAYSTDERVIETSRTLGATRLRALRLALNEHRAAIFGVILAAFGRCLTELGIAITVGGNLAQDTRTLPGAIQRSLNRGELGEAIAAGMILLGLALLVTVGGQILARESLR